MRPYSPLPRTRAGAALVAIAVAGLSGCDIPTDLPGWDTRWVIPAQSTAFELSDLLPPSMVETEGGEAFEVSLSEISFSRSLREMCAACAVAAGAIVPKPSFTTSFGGEIGLPDELLSADLIGGELRFRIHHDFPFDPLRPSASARGYLILTARSGSAVVARDSIDGREAPLPPGAVLSRTLPLQTAPIREGIQVQLTLHSPAGDPVAIDPDDRLQVTVEPSRITLGEARILVPDREVETLPIQLELDEIDPGVSDRVRAGAVRLQIDNPFDLSGTLQLRISSAAGEIVRPVAITPGESESRIELSGDEIRSILGQPDVRLVIRGGASSPAEGTVVRPAQEISIRARLELVVNSRRD